MKNDPPRIRNVLPTTTTLFQRNLVARNRCNDRLGEVPQYGATRVPSEAPGKGHRPVKGAKPSASCARDLVLQVRSRRPIRYGYAPPGARTHAHSLRAVAVRLRDRRGQ